MTLASYERVVVVVGLLVAAALAFAFGGLVAIAYGNGVSVPFRSITSVTGGSRPSW